MTGYRVFLRGEPSTEHVLAALELVHPLLALDGPIGPADLVGVRGSLLIELREDHEETDHAGLARYPLLVRFVPAANEMSAWIAAHAFLWRVTRGGHVDEALLLGGDAEPLRYRRGRIEPLHGSRSRTED